MRTGIIAGRLLLYSYNDTTARQVVSTWAVVPNTDWDGLLINILDWKAKGDVVQITYMTSTDPWSPVHDVSLPIVRDTVPLRPPTRSKHWQLNSTGSYWFNTKTGEKAFIQ